MAASIIASSIVSAARAAGVVPAGAQPVFTQADIRRVQGAGGINPSAMIDGKATAGSQVNTFDLRSSYVFTFNLGISAYKRQNLTTVGNLDLQTFAALPLPGEIIDSLGVRYDTTELGFLVGRATAGMNPFGKDSDTNTNIQSALKGLAGTIQSFSSGIDAAAKGILGTVAAAVGSVLGQVPIASQSQSAALAAFGIAPNPFMIVVFKQPEYKIHQFSWNLTARTPKESFKIASLIAFLKNAMSPGVDFTGSFFTYPSIFSLSFGYTGKKTIGTNLDLIKAMLYRFKPCVLTDIQTNYTPNGLPSMYSQTQAPQSVTINLKFMEIEFWINGQLNSDIAALRDLGGGLSPTVPVAATTSPLSSLPSDIISTLGTFTPPPQATIDLGGPSDR